MKVLREITLTFLMAIFLFFILQASVQSFVIVEHCMEPEFQEGERVLVDKVTYHFSEPKRGDVVILHPPFAPETVYIKRVIAIPGDSVEIKDGVVYVNEVRLVEPYVVDFPRYTYSLKEVPQNEYFVLGDSRNIANDSHQGWTLPRENIIGKALFSYWPLQELGLVRHYPLAEQLASATE